MAFLARFRRFKPDKINVPLALLLVLPLVSITAGMIGLVGYLSYRNEQILTAIPESNFTAEIHRNTRTIALLFLLALSAAVGCGIGIANLIVAPRLRRNRASQKLAAGDLSSQLLTNRKLVGLAQQQVLQELTHHIDTSPLATIRWDQDFRIKFWSEQAEKIFGWSEAEVLGKTLYDWQFIFEDDVDRVNQAAAQLLKGNSTICANRNYRKDGAVIYCEWYNSILLDAQGNLVSILSLVQDVSDRQRAEAALKASETRLRLALKASSAIAWERDLTTDEVFVSSTPTPSTSPTYSYQQSLQQVHPDDREQVERAYEDAIAQRGAIQIEHRVLVNRETSEYRWFQINAKVLTDEANQPARIIGLAVDISDRKQVEQDLQQAKEAAEAANLAKSLFLANMSHELRTPLNVILGYAQLMSFDASISPEYQEYLRSIYRSGDHLLLLINDVLDLSKIEAGRLTLQASQFDFANLLQTLQEIFQPRAEAKGLHWLLDVPSDLPQSLIADANKLRQVLVNLLSNAVKFTGAGTVSLYVRLEAQQNKRSNPSSSTLHFKIIDTGAGISPAERDTIFEAFFQASAGRQSTRGTGLGLTLSREFVRLMGGELTVESTTGRGSCFSFWIPVQLVSTVEALPVAPTRPVVGLLPGQTQYRILVVDDQPDNRQLLAQLLRKVGLEVQEATNGVEAIQQWHTWRPHLIWMDIRMPGMTGYEVIRQIRALEADGQGGRERGSGEVREMGSKGVGKRGSGEAGKWGREQACEAADADASTPPSPIPIIAITAQVYQEDRDRVLAAGFTDFMTKPFEVTAIFQQMATHLGLRYQYADIAPEAADASVNSSADRSQPLQPADLQVMPVEWIAAFYKASLNCSLHQVGRLIAEIPSDHTRLIEGLQQLSYHFEFGALMELSHPESMQWLN